MERQVVSGSAHLSRKGRWK